MNLQRFRKSKVLMNLNKSVAHELNQPTSFPTTRSNKKSEKPNKAQNPINPQNQWIGLFFLKSGFFLTLVTYHVEALNDNISFHTNNKQSVFNTSYMFPLPQPSRKGDPLLHRRLGKF